MQVIYNLIGMENKGESLPSPLTSATTGKKSGRKEEQYRLMFQVGILASHWSTADAILASHWSSAAAILASHCIGPQLLRY